MLLYFIIIWCVCLQVCMLKMVLPASKWNNMCAWALFFLHQIYLRVADQQFACIVWFVLLLVVLIITTYRWYIYIHVTVTCMECSVYRVRTELSRERCFCLLFLFFVCLFFCIVSLLNYIFSDTGFFPLDSFSLCRRLKSLMMRSIWLSFESEKTVIIW